MKCTHGAAIGQLDEDAIFYLRARGLTYAEARDMLIHAFAGEILDRVKIEPLKRGARSGCSTRSWRRTSRRSTRHDSRIAAAGRARSTSQRVRADFPILREQVHGRPLVYLDNAATTQKPAGRARRDARYYTETTPTSTAACTS